MKFKMLTAIAGTLASPGYYAYETHEAAESAANALAEQGTKACIFTDAPELAKAASGAFLAAVYNHISPIKIKKFKNNTIGATRVVALLEPITEFGSLTFVPEAPTSDTVQQEEPATGATADTAADTTAVLTAAEGDAGGGQSPNGEGDDMATKSKSKTKAKRAKKESNGLPREGSKKAELLRLLQRKSGATMAEMLEATGWKACLGTAKQVATAAGLKFRCEKSESGKGATRWYAE